MVRWIDLLDFHLVLVNFDSMFKHRHGETATPFLKIITKFKGFIC